MLRSTNTISEPHQYRVTLRHIAGIRGALLSFTPLLFALGATSGWMLLYLVISSTLWQASAVPLILLAVAGYWVVRRQQCNTRLSIEPATKTVKVNTSHLGTWTFALDQFAGFRVYLSESQHQRRKDLAVRLAGLIAGAGLLYYLQAYTLLFFAVIFGIVFYPLTSTNQPTFTGSGIILYFAKPAWFSPHQPLLSTIHVSANDATVEAIKQVIQPFISTEANKVL